MGGFQGERYWVEKFGDGDELVGTSNLSKNDYQGDQQIPWNHYRYVLQTIIIHLIFTQSMEISKALLR